MIHSIKSLFEVEENTASEQFVAKKAKKENHPKTKTLKKTLPSFNACRLAPKSQIKNT